MGLRFSVIVPCYLDTDALARCLACLEDQRMPRSAFEVIVVDNGSTVRPAAVLGERFPWVRWEFEEQPGSYAARNRGARVANGEALAFTDSDCLPTADWLRAASQRLKRESPNTIVGGAISLVVAHPPRPTASELYELGYAFQQQRYVEADGFAATANVVFRRELFELVGPFDAARRSGGDREWCERARARGCRVVYEPNAIVGHRARQDLDALLTKARRLAGGFHQRTASTLHGRLVRARLIASLTVPTPALARVALESKALVGPRQRVVALAVAQLVRWQQVGELVRLELGGRPIR